MFYAQALFPLRSVPRFSVHWLHLACSCSSKQISRKEYGTLQSKSAIKWPPAKPVEITLSCWLLITKDPSIWAFRWPFALKRFHLFWKGSATCLVSRPGGHCKVPQLPGWVRSKLRTAVWVDQQVCDASRPISQIPGSSNHLLLDSAL